MGKTIGIDLGTTNSVVAVVGAYGPERNRFGRISVLADEVGRTIQASAICEVDGKLVFGDDGKRLAAEGRKPSRFWKRDMGKGITFPLLGKQVKPQELSRRLLEYLSQIAAKAMGEDVDAAVIAHPAYFGGDAILATAEAGNGADLKVG